MPPASTVAVPRRARAVAYTSQRKPATANLIPISPITVPIAGALDIFHIVFRRERGADRKRAVARVHDRTKTNHLLFVAMRQGQSAR
eukprot:3833263-Pyramimonas_sp.AAC.1